MRSNLNYRITKINQHEPDVKVNDNKLMTLLFKMVALWLLDEKDDVNFRGTEDEIRALSQVMLASKEFYQYLRNTDDIDPNVLSSLLKRKNNFSQKFYQVFNANWPF
jgi:hypothetical protein